MTSSPHEDEASQCIDSHLQLEILTLTVNSRGWGTEETFQQPTRPAEYVNKRPTGTNNQLNRTTVKSENKTNFNIDSK